MIDLLPEQTAYAEFTLTETPDSLPTVAAYKVSADGVFGAESGMSETVVNVSGLSYYASAIVPNDAAPGDRYSLLVTVTVAGDVSVFWLALGQVATPIPGIEEIQQASEDALTAYDAAKSSDIPLPDGPFIPVVSVDVSVNPWEMVFYDPTDGTTEIDRRALYEVDGTPITSVTQTVGRQLKV